MKNRADWDIRVRHAFGTRWSSMPSVLDYYLGIWGAYLEAGLADAEVVSASAGSADEALSQRIWEMQLARHLIACGHLLTRRPRGEPDFCFEHRGKVIWVEAVCPAPGKAAPTVWLDRSDPPPGGRVTEAPLDWILSRWTAALRDKRLKGEHYVRKGVVKPDDSFVIAIEGGQLCGRTPQSHGRSRYPFVVEATLAVGPMAFAFSREDARFLGTRDTTRSSFEKNADADIPTDLFLAPENASVAALLGCCPPMFCGPLLPVQVALNPLATAPVPPGTFGTTAEEWSANIVEADGGTREWDIHRLGGTH